MEKSMIAALFAGGRAAKGMTLEATAAALRERGHTTATATVARWEKGGSIPLSEACDLLEILEMSITIGAHA